MDEREQLRVAIRGVLAMYLAQPAERDVIADDLADFILETVRDRAEQLTAVCVN